MNFAEYNRDLYLKDFLENLFETFRKNSIEFLVLRNYTELPEHLRDGGDIDFLLSESSFPKIYEVLSTINGLNILVSSKRTVVHEFIVRYNKKLFVKLDFHPFEDWHGAIYMKAKDILVRSQAYKMFRVPSNFHQAITMLFASYLYGAFIKQKYMPFVKAVLASDPKIETLVPVFGEVNVKAIQEFGKGNISATQFLTLRKKFLRKLFMYNFKNEGWKFVRRFIITRIEEIKLRIKYNGLVIDVDTKDNETAINDIRNFFGIFLGEDRVSVLSKNASLKKALKTWDEVGRLRFVIYDKAKPLLARKPDLIVTDEHFVCDIIVDYLIERQKGRRE